MINFEKYTVFRDFKIIHVTIFVVKHYGSSFLFDSMFYCTCAL